MFFLWYFSIAVWTIPSLLIGYGTHSFMIGMCFFMTVAIWQTWMSVIVYLIKEGDQMTKEPHLVTSMYTLESGYQQCLD